MNPIMDPDIDPDMMIVKKLIDGDVSHSRGLYLPKSKMDKILEKKGVTIPQNGRSMEVQDKDKSYWVILKKYKNGYFIGEGWSNIRNTKELKKGQLIQLYWKDGRFVFSIDDESESPGAKQANQIGESSSSKTPIEKVTNTKQKQNVSNKRHKS